MLAASSGHTDTVKALVAAGARLSVDNEVRQIKGLKNEFMHCPLMYYRRMR